MMMVMTGTARYYYVLTSLLPSRAVEGEAILQSSSGVTKECASLRNTVVGISSVFGLKPFVHLEGGLRRIHFCHCIRTLGSFL